VEKWIIRDVLEKAYKEDMPFGDITTDYSVPENVNSRAYMITKQEGVIAGIEVCIEAFKMLDPDTKVIPLVEDGDFVEAGTRILEIEGKSRALLKAERTASKSAAKA